MCNAEGLCIDDTSSYPFVCLGWSKPSAATCGSVKDVGCCDDQGRVVYCENNLLYCFDCNQNALTDPSQATCGWNMVQQFAGYDCGGNGADPSGRNPLECGAPCTSSCTGLECGSDGCGGSCGTCDDGKECQAGQCAYPGAEYPDICLGFQKPSKATCSEDYSSTGCCDERGRVVWCDKGQLFCNDCPSQPSPANTCGWVTIQGFSGYDCGGTQADPSGIFPRTCGTTCQPDCTGRQCGDNGCGDSCGACSDGILCDAGQCVVPPGGVVTGRLEYEVRGPVIDGNGRISIGPAVLKLPGGRMPLRVVGADGSTIGEALVGPDGNFTIPLVRNPQAGDKLVVIAVHSRPHGPLFAVLKPAAGGTPGTRTSPVWAWSVDLSGRNAGTITVTEADGSGAVHLYRLVHDGLDVILEHITGGSTREMGSLAVLWAPGIGWDCALCYGFGVSQQVKNGGYVSQSIFVDGKSGSSSAWAAAGVLHEFGHYVVNNYSRDNSPGGAHAIGDLITPPFAWAEAYANYFGIATHSRVLGRADALLWAIYVTAGGSTSAFWIDFVAGRSVVGAFQKPKPALGMNQNLDECWLTSVLWDLWGGDGLSGTWPADGPALGTAGMIGHVRTTRLMNMDRGYPGVDLVDFLDSVVCDKPALKTGVMKTVKDLHEFPYDGNPLCQ
jgi:hypothetical protein